MIGTRGEMRNRQAAALALLLAWFGVGPWLTDEYAPAHLHAQDAVTEFPDELLHWEPYSNNPVFTAAGPNHWDVKIRERGWIIKEGDSWSLWYTGYDGTREGVKHLGYATSDDGLHWTRLVQHPIHDERWVEDVCVIKVGETYHMFAEGLNDQAQRLTSRDKVHWHPEGTIDIRDTQGAPLAAGPFGTPTAYYEDGTWYLFYERSDQAIWLATSQDLKVFQNVQDEPVIGLGPEYYDSKMIAMNQIVKFNGKYYAVLHGSGSESKPSLWTTNLAVSNDLKHWKKYSKNPLRPESENKSSGLLIHDGHEFRLYTMHDKVDVHFHTKK